MTVRTNTPGDTVAYFSELLGAGRLDALIELYEQDATFVAEPGRVVHGRESIRTEFEQLVALGPSMHGSVERVLRSGDTALVAYRWRLTATGPDGAAIHQGGLSADVLRQRPDGTWAVLIDDPYGAGA
jgi:uncharacterized protein (TIGR02246 family)